MAAKSEPVHTATTTAATNTTTTNNNNPTNNNTDSDTGTNTNTDTAAAYSLTCAGPHGPVSVPILPRRDPISFDVRAAQGEFDLLSRQLRQFDKQVGTSLTLVKVG